MVKVQLDLNKKEDSKLKKLKHRFEMESKTDAIKKAIRDFPMESI